MAIIYKYRNWENLTQRRFITNNEIYFASAKSLNDPLEVVNVFHFEMLSEDEKLLLISRVIVQNESFLNDNVVLIKARNWLDNDRTNSFAQLSRHGKRVTKKLRKKVGIFSTSNTGDNNHVWKYYANDYSGFCIGYDLDELRKYLYNFGQGSFGGDVKYYEELPVLIPNIHDRIEDAFFLCITKTKKWEKEDEHRIVKFQFVKKKVSIKSPIIKEIIIGENMLEKSERELLKYVYSKYHNCKVLRAMRPTSSNESVSRLIEI